LGKCRGACVGEEKPGLYNARLALGLAKYRIKPWPYDGPIMISEGDEERQEAHILDKWCYLGTVDLAENSYPANEEMKFDVDMYKILNRFLRGERRSVMISKIDGSKGPIQERSSSRYLD
jgi:DNA polymerase-3 subunit epsilon